MQLSYSKSKRKEKEENGFEPRSHYCRWDGLRMTDMDRWLKLEYWPLWIETVIVWCSVCFGSMSESPKMWQILETSKVVTSEDDYKYGQLAEDRILTALNWDSYKICDKSCKRLLCSGIRSINHLNAQKWPMEIIFKKLFFNAEYLDMVYLTLWIQKNWKK